VIEFQNLVSEEEALLTFQVAGSAMLALLFGFALSVIGYNKRWWSDDFFQMMMLVFIGFSAAIFTTATLSTYSSYSDHSRVISPDEFLGLERGYVCLLREHKELYSNKYSAFYKTDGMISQAEYKILKGFTDKAYSLKQADCHNRSVEEIKRLLEG